MDNFSRSDLELDLECVNCPGDACFCAGAAGGECDCGDECSCELCHEVVEVDVVVVSAGSKPAPKKDRIRGSERNRAGSATRKRARTIQFSKKTEDALRKKVADHNAKASDGRRATLAMLKAVYRRGSGAYSSSHRPGKTRDQWAMARVNAFLRLLRTGRPANANYVQDNDLLPSAHPKATTASAATAQYNAALTVELRNPLDYATPEEAILELAEFSGGGYEMIEPIRAAWRRGVRDGNDPYRRAHDLAVDGQQSRDADLLPRLEGVEQ